MVEKEGKEGGTNVPVYRLPVPAFTVSLLKEVLL